MQTATNSQLYFNYFIYESTPKEVLSQLLEETKLACKKIESYLEEQFQRYLSITGLPSRNLSREINVTSYAKYIKGLEAISIHTESTIQSALQKVLQMIYANYILK
ncbi:MULTISPECIES: hypothetical protein [Bacillus cereus group]|uniref:Uncharacterized protein n=1 Tax=Bacillus proteolyticus TaxID=2026192 RepID=A0ABV3IKC0_9BACI|nr:hypothetical protein [Bacillus cereus group sp. N8]MBJ8107976.1 hypothetical protein [Bacillus cereus group sp. N8]